MVNERDRNRELYPDFAEVVDSIRASGGNIEAAWIEDTTTGEVLAGKRPYMAHEGVYVEPEAWLKQIEELEGLRQLREANVLKLRKRGYRV